MYKFDNLVARIGVFFVGLATCANVFAFTTPNMYSVSALFVGLFLLLVACTPWRERS